MSGDAGELFGWGPGVGSDWVQLGDETFRPATIEALFSMDGKQSFKVTAVADEHGVKITQVSWTPDAAGSDQTEALRRFDVEAAAAALERATVIEYLPQGWIRFGADAPFLWSRDVRRYLLGPAAVPVRPGPKRKASLEQTAKLWHAATRKGRPPARAVAEALAVSISTAHRYIADARKAGLIKEEAK